MWSNPQVHYVRPAFNNVLAADNRLMASIGGIVEIGTVTDSRKCIEILQAHKCHKVL